MSSSPGTRAIWGIFTVAIALVWGINGLWCKVLGGVPRHEAIVARVVDTATDIVGLDLDAAAAAAAAGVLVVWFVSGRWVRLNAAAQVVIVMTMNVIEQLLAPELLLFGPWNFLWASCFSAAVLVRTRLHVQRLAQEGA